MKYSASENYLNNILTKATKPIIVQMIFNTAGW